MRHNAFYKNSTKRIQHNRDEEQDIVIFVRDVSPRVSLDRISGTQQIRKNYDSQAGTTVKETSTPGGTCGIFSLVSNLCKTSPVLRNFLTFPSLCMCQRARVCASGRE